MYYMYQCINKLVSNHLTSFTYTSFIKVLPDLTYTCIKLPWATTSRELRTTRRRLLSSTAHERSIADDDIGVDGVNVDTDGVGIALFALFSSCGPFFFLPLLSFLGLSSLCAFGIIVRLPELLLCEAPCRRSDRVFDLTDGFSGLSYPLRLIFAWLGRPQPVENSPES